MTLLVGEGCENYQRMALILEYREEFHTVANIISLKLYENIIYLNSYEIKVQKHEQKGKHTVDIKQGLCS